MYYKAEEAWTQYTKNFEDISVCLDDIYAIGYTYEEVFHILKNAVYLNEPIDMDFLRTKIDISPWMAF